MESIDQIVKSSNKPDWKQLIPIYGYYQIYKDEIAKKPVIGGPKLSYIGPTTLSNFKQKIERDWILAYHVLAAGGSLYGLAKLVEKLQ